LAGGGGTIRWSADTLVNEYVEQGAKMRDIWTAITPRSYTLIEQGVYALTDIYAQ
jgi:hypothetical protein